MSDPLRALASRVEGSPYGAHLGVVVETIATDRAVVRVPYKDENSNPGRALHGGVYASVIDLAGVLAATTAFPDGAREAGSLDLTVVYLAAAIGEDIVADAQVLRRGKEIVYAEVDVRTAGGKRVAKGLVTHRALVEGPGPAAAERQRSARAGGPPPTDGAEVPKLARAIVSVPFMKGLGLDITRMHDGHALVRMPFAPGLTTDGTTVHEGAVAALLDTTGAMASWSTVGLDLRYKASTVGIHVSFHRPAAGEALRAEAWTRRRNDEIFLSDVTVSGADSGQVIAAGSVTYRIVVP
jgi:uncharacterized protein (TIGR00369 family)